MLTSSSKSRFSLAFSFLLCCYLSSSAQTTKTLEGQKDDTVTSLLLHRMVSADTLSVIHSSQGCFHKYENSIQIINVNDTFYLLDSGKSSTLSASAFEAIEKFELHVRKLPLISSYGCTTIEYFKISLNGESLSKWDDSCSNYFFDHLIKSLKTQD